jgi:hypothetical protein
MSSVFKRSRPDSSASEHAPQASLSFDAHLTKSERIGSFSTQASYDLKTCQSNETNLRDLTRYLPHTLITSDLGEWGRNFCLQFSHFLPENPSVAVFLESQDSPVPNTWRHKQPWRPWRLNFRCRWRKGELQVRSPCTVMVIVGSRWQYKISMQAVQRWSASARMLLVDWSEMYDDYFEQDRKKTNRLRTHVIVRRFRKLEEKSLVMETGAL